MTTTDNNKEFNEVDDLMLFADRAVTALQTASLTPLPLSTSKIISDAVGAAYRLGREHEKSEDNLISDAHLRVMDGMIEARVLATIAAVMHSDRRSTLALSLDAARTVFQTHKLRVKHDRERHTLIYTLVPHAEPPSEDSGDTAFATKL